MNRYENVSFSHLTSFVTHIDPLSDVSHEIEYNNKLLFFYVFISSDIFAQFTSVFFMKFSVAMPHLIQSSLAKLHSYVYHYIRSFLLFNIS